MRGTAFSNVTARMFVSLRQQVLHLHQIDVLARRVLPRLALPSVPLLSNASMSAPRRISMRLAVNDRASNRSLRR